MDFGHFGKTYCWSFFGIQNSNIFRRNGSRVAPQAKLPSHKASYIDPLILKFSFKSELFIDIKDAIRRATAAPPWSCTGWSLGSCTGWCVSVVALFWQWGSAACCESSSATWFWSELLVCNSVLAENGAIFEHFWSIFGPRIHFGNYVLYVGPRGTKT